MANAEIKLYYFDGKGRAEVARLILIAAGKEFEDIRFQEQEWPEYKAIAPFGQCPFLKVDDETYSQSLAINAFLAKEFGFYSQTNLEALEIDQVANLVEDFVRVCVDVLHMEDEDEKLKAIEKTKTDVSPKFLGYFEKLLNKTGSGYFVGDRLTLADIAVFDIVTGMLEKYVDVNDNYPLLQKNVENVRAHSKIGPYIASRPETKY